MSAIVVDNLTKQYGDFAAVDHIGFEVASGQVVALLGPNGAGKTTTLEILEGFIVADGGEVRVLGADPRRGGRQWRARIGLVQQSSSLDLQLTPRELLNLFARLFPRPRLVKEVLETVELVDEADTRIGALSGGQHRRVDLALGIIGRPEMLFLDEPTTGLDPEARRRLWTGIENLTEAGTTVLLTTHYLDEAQQLADRVIVLARGKIVADGSPDRLRAGMGTTIRYPLPADVPLADLPAVLARAIDPERRELVIRTADVTGILETLVSWARRRRLDLGGLEVGAPSLEEAYLSLTSEFDEAERDMSYA